MKEVSEITKAKKQKNKNETKGKKKRQEIGESIIERKRDEQVLHKKFKEITITI